MSVAILEYFLHTDTHLITVIQQFGLLTYLILFLVVFSETGLVVMPFLPGDSLLFAAGTIAAKDALSVPILYFIFTVAAILGDSVNYGFGAWLGKRLLKRNWRFINREDFTRTQQFYEREGGKTIIIARFLPIIRTFAPFVAGVGRMNYYRFMFFNVIGALLWVTLFLLGGYSFGNIPWVERNFSVVILAIIAVSVLPGIVESLRRHRRRRRRAMQK